VQGRLRAAGLFDQLAALRWGPSPYWPKASFSPRAQAIGDGFLGAYQARLKEALGEHALDEHRQEYPGELSVQVELGKAKMPSEEQFRELLDRAVRIARLSAEAEG
jgi:hypothetical protein